VLNRVKWTRPSKPTSSLTHFKSSENYDFWLVAKRRGEEQFVVAGVHGELHEHQGLPLSLAPQSRWGRVCLCVSVFVSFGIYSLSLV
jgi:hypothetical protein